VLSTASYDVQIYEALEALPVDFRALFDKAGRQSVFSTWTWYANFVESVLARGETLRIYAVRSSGRPRAVLVTHHASLRPFSVRKLMSLSNYYSSLFGPVVDPDDPEMDSLLTMLAKAIARDRSRWDEIYLNPLAVEAQSFATLLRALRAEGFLVDRFFSFGNWYVPVGSQTFEQYAQGRPRTGARQRKKLLPSTRFRFSLVTRPEEVQSAMADYERVYRSSWKTGEPHPGFMAGLAQGCAEQGWLRLGIAYVDGEPAAAQLWIVADGTASIFKVAYDDHGARHRPR
jgi:broad specificity phosphatase PhoE